MSSKLDHNDDLSTVKDVVAYLNSKAGKSYKATSKMTQKHIKARLNEGYTLDDFKTVIDRKCRKWLGTKMEDYLRPETLFGTKFEGYLNESDTIETTHNPQADLVSRTLAMMDQMEGEDEQS
jgi:uncharacterized phage protein (TIGR02220 family)